MVDNMTTLIQYEARDFLIHMEKIKIKVHGEVCKQLNQGLEQPQYYPEFIEVYTRVMRPDGEVINLRDGDISSIDMYPEDTKVYQTHTKSLCGEIVTVEIVFIARYVHYNKQDIVGIGDTPRTFNTYEEFLVFINQAHEKQNPNDGHNISVSLFDKGTNIELFDAFRNLRRKDSSLPTLTEDEFTTLDGYHGLSKDIKGNVDKAICPLTLTQENVQLIHSNGWYNVYVDKSEFINRHLLTTNLDSVILPLLK